ncbi:MULTISPECIES: threonine synthase [Acidianus]|uniref:Threonine synthase n=1 Tax=Candidatus Acidianus copahuensis TaxID=1160895 RepID=A0A031LP40_9CREN|nr:MULTISPECIES: threonine synthase [Acidianus]EZQ06832.1 threonine synthase [Candidatus Acidianus copahuensis]NON61491.1 threonine synthase [Acidianus sp. RZ1]
MKCLECGYESELSQRIITCPKCGGIMEIKVKIPSNFNFSMLRGRGVWRYRDAIPGNYNKTVSISEGGTPLVSSSFSSYLFYKFEGANPTGSFKDRGMTIAISSALSEGYKVVVAASTGNTAASAAAYAARGKMRIYLVLPSGKVALGKLAQSILYGATILEVNGSFDVAMSTVLRLYKELGVVYPLNSFNPWRLEGQKTIAYEIAEEIGVPDNVVVPVGNAGNVYAIWKGFVELMEAGVTSKIPKMIGVQAEGASPIARAIQKGESIPEFVDSPETVATAIRIGKPVNWKKAIKAIVESRGNALTVSDNEILEAQKKLARLEGLGAEPASAASLAGYQKAIEKGILGKDEKTVLILTGHALKDPDAMLKSDARRILVNPDHVDKIILGELDASS